MPYVIVGDEAFPLKKYLLRPYPGSQIQGDQKEFSTTVFHASEEFQKMRSEYSAKNFSFTIED